MRKEYLIVALGLFAAGTAGADVVSVPETANTPRMTVPAKGTSMAEVQKKFGEPRDKKATVGGDTPRQPPITRWDYDGFVVIFEKDRVVDAVVPGAPPRLRSTAGLTPATNAPPPPAMPPPDAPPPAEAPAEDPMIPETPAEEPAAPMEPTAEAPPAEPEAPAAEPPAQQMQPAPVEQEIPEDAAPTPK